MLNLTCHPRRQVSTLQSIKPSLANALVLVVFYFDPSFNNASFVLPFFRLNLHRKCWRAGIRLSPSQSPACRSSRSPFQRSRWSVGCAEWRTSFQCRHAPRPAWRSCGPRTSRDLAVIWKKGKCALSFAVVFDEDHFDGQARWVEQKFKNAFN